MESKVEKAVYLFTHGYNCAQAVLCAYAEEFNADHDLLYKVSEGFGSGVPGYTGICGAASGMVMAAGLALSDTDVTKKSKSASYPKIKKYHEIFAEQMGGLECKELKLTKDQTLIHGKRAGCIACVECAARIVEEEMLKKEAK